MAHWDGEKVVGNKDIKFCCVKIKTGEQADTEETNSIIDGEKEIKESVAKATGGVGGTIGNVITIGGVNRAGNAGENAAIEVIHKRVPGVTARVVRTMQYTVPIGLIIMFFSIYLANTQQLENDNQNYYYFGVLFGAYFCYSPAINEKNDIKKEAESAGSNAGALLPNLCTIQ